ncbi:MAG TPA: response regulator [Terriglobales bacterium]|nr:response regulator [Terriglobales bacterium]
MLSAQLSDTKRTVLVIDDSAEMQRYLRLMLELESYTVETANNGMEALQRLAHGCKPSVILLDLQMPGMNGFRTLKRLHSYWPDLKVIMCSGVDDPRSARIATRLGARAYLTKPVQQLYLSAAIEHCLNEKEGMPPILDESNVITLPVPVA